MRHSSIFSYSFLMLSSELGLSVHPALSDHFQFNRGIHQEHRTGVCHEQKGFRKGPGKKEGTPGK
jgi:hypothetical protein